MKRLTRKIGLFGGPGALMSPMGAKKSVSAGSVPKAASGSVAATRSGEAAGAEGLVAPASPRGRRRGTEAAYRRRLLRFVRP